jgi:hypothetical protein
MATDNQTRRSMRRHPSNVNTPGLRIVRDEGIPAVNVEPDGREPVVLGPATGQWLASCVQQMRRRLAIGSPLTVKELDTYNRMADSMIAVLTEQGDAS